MGYLKDPTGDGQEGLEGAVEWVAGPGAVLAPLGTRATPHWPGECSQVRVSVGGEKAGMMECALCGLDTACLDVVDTCPVGEVVPTDQQ